VQGEQGGKRVPAHGVHRLVRGTGVGGLHPNHGWCECHGRDGGDHELGVEEYARKPAQPAWGTLGDQHAVAEGESHAHHLDDRRAAPPPSALHRPAKRVPAGAQPQDDAANGRVHLDC